LHGSHAAICIRTDFGGHLMEVDEIAHERAFERRMNARVCEAVGIGEIAPAVEVDGHVHGLAGVGDEMAPVPNVADDELFAQSQVEPKILTVRLLPGGLQPCFECTPHAEVLAQLLKAVEDLVWEIASGILSLCRSSGALLSIEELASRRQASQWHHAAGDDS